LNPHPRRRREKKNLDGKSNVQVESEHSTLHTKHNLKTKSPLSPPPHTHKITKLVVFWQNFLSQFGKFLSLKKKEKKCNKIFPFEKRVLPFHKYLQNKKTELHINYRHILEYLISFHYCLLNN
jgi:hypothetical protein